jgi:hypothetical protein
MSTTRAQNTRLFRRSAILATLTGALALGGAGWALSSAQEPLQLGECPENTTNLPRSAIAWATLAALRDADEVYPEKNLRRMSAQRAYIAADNTDRGAPARRQCGREIQRRTVVVDLNFPAEPGASQSQGTVYVARIGGDKPSYRVWERVK